jgi:hypothetical protein
VRERKFEIGARVRRRDNSAEGVITFGPLMYGGDWYVLWDGRREAVPEYCADLRLDSYREPSSESDIGGGRG